jgi:energy-coupling factor transporter ATP-binding protein EcfA2
MTLLLGPPACGKSTLLKLLAGRLTGSSAAGLDVSGEVTYNGQKPDSFDVVRTCAFVNQVCVCCPQHTVPYIWGPIQAFTAGFPAGVYTMQGGQCSCHLERADGPSLGRGWKTTGAFNNGSC